MRTTSLLFRIRSLTSFFGSRIDKSNLGFRKLRFSRAGVKRKLDSVTTVQYNTAWNCAAPEDFGLISGRNLRSCCKRSMGWRREMHLFLGHGMNQLGVQYLSWYRPLEVRGGSYVASIDVLPPCTMYVCSAISWRQPFQPLNPFQYPAFRSRTR